MQWLTHYRLPHELRTHHGRLLRGIPHLLPRLGRLRPQEPPGAGGRQGEGYTWVLVPGPDIYYLLLSVFTLECLEHVARVRGVHRPAHRPQAGAVHRGGAVGGHGRHAEGASTYLHIYTTQTFLP